MDNEIQDDKCFCGAESEIGCHGIRDGVVYDEYYCLEHYNKKKRNQQNESSKNERAAEKS